MNFPKVEAWLAHCEANMTGYKEVSAEAVAAMEGPIYKSVCAKLGEVSKLFSVIFLKTRLDVFFNFFPGVTPLSNIYRNPPMKDV